MVERAQLHFGRELLSWQNLKSKLFVREKKKEEVVCSDQGTLLKDLGLPLVPQCAHKPAQASKKTPFWANF